MKIHYIGYGNENDEWKDKSEIENLTLDEDEGEDDNPGGDVIDMEGYQPFSFYKQLRIRINL